MTLVIGIDQTPYVFTVTQDLEAADWSQGDEPIFAPGFGIVGATGQAYFDELGSSGQDGAVLMLTGPVAFALQGAGIALSPAPALTIAIGSFMIPVTTDLQYDGWLDAEPVLAPCFGMPGDGSAYFDSVTPTLSQRAEFGIDVDGRAWLKNADVTIGPQFPLVITIGANSVLVNQNLMYDASVDEATMLAPGFGLNATGAYFDPLGADLGDGALLSTAGPITLQVGNRAQYQGMPGGSHLAPLAVQSTGSSQWQVVNTVTGAVVSRVYSDPSSANLALASYYSDFARAEGAA